MKTKLPVTVDDVRAAAARIEGGIVRTPCSPSRTLSAITGADVVVKFENVQFTASYKERGALNRLLLLDDAERARGVIASSAGNHAQAIAYHATRLGMPATIVMPETTAFVKVERTTALGATVVQHGANVSESGVHARGIAERDGLVFVHPFDDPIVIAGQGTLALEMLADHPDLEAIIAPVGGGGMLSGISLVARDIAPDVELIGVQAETCPSMVLALAGEAKPATCETVADGIQVPEAGKITREIVGALADDVITVSEVSIEEAISLYLEIEKTVAEGAGATSLAALLEHGDRFRGRKVGIVLSGGNLDSRVLATVITRSLARTGRLSHLSVDLSDTPGALARLATVIGDHGANIVEIEHRRDLPSLQLRRARLEVTIETRNRAHVDEIIDALEVEGWPVHLEAIAGVPPLLC
ncbi:MAG: threonine ammonia-lyase [Acidimicrobiia bacterium]